MADGARDVVIIGMAGIFPKAESIRTFWENILAGVDAIGDPPAEWGADLVYDPGSGENDRIYTKRGGYLGDLARFEPLAYGVMPRSVEGGEPEHFIALRLAHEALADAGYADRPFDRERTDVILGRGTYVNRGYVTLLQHGLIVDQTVRILQQLHPTHSSAELEEIKRHLKGRLPPFNAETAPSLAHSVMCGRIANRLDLMGSAYTVDAACASSLIAVELGMKALTDGDCDLVLAGGIQVSTAVPIALLFCQLGALSRSGRLRPFHAEGDGTLLGEGAGIIVLKRRADAERDGDRIYAVIKGVGSASDGRALGVLAPRVEGEALAIRRAYERARVSPQSVGLIEAHGTGTPVGDGTEIEALGRVFGMRENGVPSAALGSVKSMIGHCIPAAGVAGIIKTALALYHKILPPTLHADSAHPKLASSRFYLNPRSRPWIHGGPEPRRAGVSAFGFGGINAHAVLEEHDGSAAPRPLVHTWRGTELFVISDATRSGVLAQCKRLQAFLRRNPDVSLCDLAYTLNSPAPNEADERLTVIAASGEELERKLEHATGRLADPSCRRIKDRSGIYYFEERLGRVGELAFLFPGEGAQYRDMFEDLCLHFTEVRRWFDLMDRAFWGHSRGFLPSQVIFPYPDGSEGGEGVEAARLWNMDSAIEAVFAANQAMSALLGRLGLRAQAVVGHSTGEYSALLAAGAIEAEDEDRLIAYIREGNQVTERATRSGVVPAAELLAVGPADPEILRGVVERSSGSIYLALDNCPHQAVLCGNGEAIARVRGELLTDGVVCQSLPFNRAYHTPLYGPVCEELRSYFDRIAFARPRIPLYSCATAARFADDPDEIRRLALEQWRRPVRFRETIEAMYEAGIRIFVEVGPRGNLTAFVEDILHGREYLAIASNVQRRSGVLQLHHLLGLLSAHGVSLALDTLYSDRGARRLPEDAIANGEVLPETQGRSIGLALALPLLGVEKLSRPDEASSRWMQDETVPVEEKLTARDALAIGTEAEVAPAEVARAQVAPAEPPLPGPFVPEPTGPPPPSVWPATAPASQPSAIPAPAAWHPSVKAPASSGGRAAIMGAYLRTMEVFLDVQAEVTGTFLRQRRGASRSGMTVPSLPAPSTWLPFIGTIIHQVAGKELIAARTLDLQEDRFLNDHTLGPRVSEADPYLAPLAVFPMALAVEMMAEVASRVAPEAQVVGLRDVRAFRWIALVTERLALEVHARRLPGAAAEVAVEIREAKPHRDREDSSPPNSGGSTSVRGNGSGSDGHGPSQQGAGPLIMEGVVLFGERVSPPPAGPFPLRQARSGSWPPERLYAEGERHGMFHGPSFQAIAAVDRVGNDGAEATIRSLSPKGMFRAPGEAGFLTDPLLLDAAGQLVGFWSADQLDRAFVIFPIGFETMDLYGRPGRSSGHLTCRARITQLDEGHVRSDLAIVGGDGEVCVQIRGWRDKRYDLPEPFYKFRLDPLEVLASEPWTAALTRCPDADRFRCCRLAYPTSFLKADAGLWAEVLAHLVLSRRERKVWRDLNGGDKRRSEWLLGRAAAKDAARLWLRERHAIRLYPADIEILTDEWGRPYVGGEGDRQPGGAPIISITHSDGLALAIAGAGGDAAPRRGIGIDVERLGVSRPWLEPAMLTPEERRCLEGLDPVDRAEWIVRLWCSKEAVGKALGRGLVGGPGDILIKELSADTGIVTMAISGRLAEQLPDHRNQKQIAYTSRDGDWIVAITL